MYERNKAVLVSVCRLKDVLRNPNSATLSIDYVEFACDGAILDLAYSSKVFVFIL